MSIINIAGYKFISLAGPLTALRSMLLAECNALACKGTILLSTEGININLAGERESIEAFTDMLRQDDRFADIDFKASYSAWQPFKRMKVKVKKEIITMGNPTICPAEQRAASITPQALKQWLDEKRDMMLLDTRNEYEIRFGTFVNAQHFNLREFSEFPKAAKTLAPTKPVVMFCTGGIRCEKAALELVKAGFPDVYQLEGGILNYFAAVGGAHYQGDCFVFDERITVNPPQSPLTCRLRRRPLPLWERSTRSGG